MRKQKEADCCQQSAGGLDCPAWGLSWPTSIIPQPGDDFKSAVRDYFESAGVVVTITETDGVPAYPVLSPSRLCVLRGAGVSPPGAAGGALGRGVARRGRVPSPTLLIDNRSVSPPSSTTGALSTSSSGIPLRADKADLILDWLHGVFLGQPIDDVLAVLADLFGEITPLERGYWGYSSMGLILSGLGKVAWDYGRPEMGVLLVLPARALGEVARLLGTDVRGFGVFLRELGFRPARVDFAMDDHEGVLDLDLMHEKARAGEFTTRWRGGPKNALWSWREDANGGRMLTFGSRASRAYLRIYDKAAERGVEGPWIRVELELKGDKAVQAWDRFLDEGPSFVPGLFRNYLEFKGCRTGDSNRTRWPIAGWWAAFLSFAEKVRLSLPAPSRTLETVKNWVTRQVAPSLALLVKAEGGAVDWLYSLIREGEARLTRAQLALLPVDV